MLDERALAAWIREFTPQLLGVARAFAEGDDEAEDLLQELWITAYTRGESRSLDAPIGAWLHSILLNIGRTRLRRRRRRTLLLSLWHRPRQVHGAPMDVEGSIQRGRLWRDVAELPELQRNVVLLRIIDELSTADAAAALGRAEGTVKASLHRAMQTLRDRLTARGERPNG